MVCSVYIYVEYVHNPESALKILWTRHKKRNGCLAKLTVDTLDEENGCRFEGQRENTGSTRPASLIVVR